MQGGLGDGGYRSWRGREAQGEKQTLRCSRVGMSFWPAAFQRQPSKEVIGVRVVPVGARGRKAVAEEI